MKYANLRINPTNVSNNIGDNMQIMAVDNLYTYMGIPNKDVVRIDFSQMDVYEGEDVILPINWYFHKFFKYGKKNVFSDKIYPIFLGASFVSNIFSDEEVAFLRRHEPIGCRDEWTYNNLKAYGIEAYLNGCMTSLFPRREENVEKQKKVFCVDVPQELLQYMPDDIKENAEFVTHVFDGKVEDIQQFTYDIYERYKREAKLVITSRLHCASPCLAAGIPVVLAIKKCIYTMGWIERYIPIYTECQFAEIDWDPQGVDYEKMKKNIMENAKKRMLQVKPDKRNLEYINNYFAGRKKVHDYIIPAVTPAIDFICRNWSREEETNYGFWGITGITDMINKYIEENYPKARLARVYDRGYVKEKQRYHDIEPELPENIKNDDVFIFVSAYSATDEARYYFEKTKRDSRSYFLCCDVKKSY